jgi:hypothetical protein
MLLTFKNMNVVTQQLRPDSKGRITLGKLAEGVSSFRMQKLEDGKILLEPFTEIPPREAWLYDNGGAIAAVKAGLKQAADGKTRSLGSFFWKRIPGIPD